MAVGFKRGRDAIKSALDRRYSTRDEMASMRAVLAGLASRIESLESEVTSLRVSVAEMTETSGRMGVTVQEADRLAKECAQAIERLLQEELLLRRDLDAAETS